VSELCRFQNAWCNDKKKVRKKIPPPSKKKKDVKVGKVKLPLWLLKQHDMEDNGELKYVVKMGTLNVLICWDVFSSMMFVISTTVYSCAC